MRHCGRAREVPMNRFCLVLVSMMLLGACTGEYPDPDGDQTGDGVITGTEVPFAAGRSTRYRVAVDVGVDTAGTPADGGQRLWDFSGALAGDQDLVIETPAIDGKWFAGTYPGATYTARLESGQDLLGVYEVADDALLLRGIVSPADGAGHTDLVYDPPAQVLAFPLQVGASFSTDSGVIGHSSGTLVSFQESFASLVDSRGTLVTPYGTIPVLRVRALMTRAFGLLETDVRSFTFVAEGHGIVASIRSQDDEPSIEFTDAAEIWRLAP
jgi:hypothetical protein